MAKAFDQVVESDILIIGCGIAGLMAALEARKYGVHVVAVGKDSGASPGLHGFNAALDSCDSFDAFFQDTIASGVYLNNYDLVRILVEEAPQVVAKLECIGVQFAKVDKGFDLLQPLGCRYPRLVHCKDTATTGDKMLKKISQEARKRDVELRTNVMVTNLLVDNGHVIGACGIDANDGCFLLFKARSIVLATGGCGQVYLPSLYPPDITADGYAMAYEAGADLLDMEFLQYEPCVIVYPKELFGKVMLTTLFMEGAELRNAEGDLFMHKFDPVMAEMTHKFVLAQAIYQETNAGRGTEHGGVYFDISMIPEEKLHRDYSELQRQLSSVGVDTKRESVEVAPAGHSSMGGVRIDTNCQSSIEGLFAAGEIAGGVHGANRMGGNAGTEVLVFGSRAGRFSAKYALSTTSNQIDPDTVARKRAKTCHPTETKAKDSFKPKVLKLRIQNTAWNYVGIIRNERSLQQALKELTMIKTKMIPRMSATNTNELLEANEVRNMLVTAEMISLAALKRTESRGTHYRKDYPVRDDEEWLKNIIVRKGDGRMRLLTSPLRSE